MLMVLARVPLQILSDSLELSIGEVSSCVP